MQRMSLDLAVRDIRASVDFYRDVLDFPEGDVYPLPSGKVVHGMVQWGPAMIVFSPVEESAAASGPRGAGVTLYIQLDDEIERYFERVVESGATIVEDLRTQYWGDRTFTVADPDGYHLAFAQHVRDVSMEEMETELAKV